MTTESRNRHLMWVGTAGVVCAMALLFAFRAFKTRGPDPAFDLKRAGPAAERAWQRIAPRLAEADQEGLRSADRHLDDIRNFFAYHRQNTAAFAEEVLGWKGKWEFVRGQFSGNGGKTHQEYLRSAFERHFFRNQDLEQFMQGMIAAYVSELEGHESAVLVAIRADLSEHDLPVVRSMAVLGSDGTLASAYQQMLADVVPIVSRDLKMTIGREAVTWVGSEIATAVTIRVGAALATRLGISSGILGTGAASTAATFGIGLGVGFLVDAGVDWALKQNGYDPAAEIANQTAAALTRIETLLIDGESGPVSPGESAPSAGLRQEFSRLRALRSQIREMALKKLLVAGSKA
jgi:hypothetical protein